MQVVRKEQRKIFRMIKEQIFEHLQQRGGGIAVGVSGQLVDLIQQDQRIVHACLGQCRHDAAGHGAEIGLAVTADIRLVPHTAERHTHVFAVHGVCDGLRHRGLAHTGRAEIYGYTTKRFNDQVKNNIEKFDEDFRFQLTLKEAETCSRSKILTLNGGHRGSNVKYAPYAFTEQGIYMLMTVLKGELATRQSMALIRLFKQMKDFIVAENKQLLRNADIAEIAIQTTQNTHKITTVSSKVEALSGEVHNVQDRLGQMDLNLQMVMENFIDPATYKHFLILDPPRE